MHSISTPTLAWCTLRTIYSGSPIVSVVRNEVCLAYDAAVLGHDVYCGAVFSNRVTGELMPLQFACSLIRPTGNDGEWHYRLVSLAALRGSTDTALLVTDSAHIYTCSFTHGPRSWAPVATMFKD